MHTARSRGEAALALVVYILVRDRSIEYGYPMALSDWASVAVTGGLGLAGLYFANSLKRRARQDLDREVADKRFVAYGSMWTYMIQASPMNAVELAEASHAGSLADGGDAQDDGRKIDRGKLFNDLTKWYYRAGHGMLLSQDARNIYLTAKANLVCAPDKFLPARAHAAVAEDVTERDRLIVRQLSLLRTAMRGDIAIYTTPWGSALTDEDVSFLYACGVDVSRDPWRGSLPRQRSKQQELDLTSLEQHPPEWLIDSIGAPPMDDGSQRIENWRRLALTAYNIQRRLDGKQRRRRSSSP